ncbi:MAG: hypothetical protein BWY57_02243 [Betaproteobacteria bacterium ADurb.Bin341]|jgi:hypothetical protein|nr:MAG: hypothetical protein BWY57_02243 [Betaproteobacteria bacterium ADurb.Bin341]
MYITLVVKKQCYLHLFFLLRFSHGFGKVAPVFFHIPGSEQEVQGFDRQQHEHARQRT